MVVEAELVCGGVDDEDVCAVVVVAVLGVLWLVVVGLVFAAVDALLLVVAELVAWALLSLAGSEDLVSSSRDDLPD